MIWWTAAFLSLTAVAVFLAWRSRRVSVTIGMGYFRSAAVVAATCVVSNGLVYFGPAPHMQFFPVMDATVGAVFIWNWYRGRRPHHLVLGLLFAAQTAVHVWYFNLPESSHAIRYAYDAMLNVTYVAQLLAVAIPSLVLLSHRRRSCRSA